MGRRGGVGGEGELELLVSRKEPSHPPRRPSPPTEVAAAFSDFEAVVARCLDSPGSENEVAGSLSEGQTASGFGLLQAVASRCPVQEQPALAWRALQLLPLALLAELLPAAFELAARQDGDAARALAAGLGSPGTPHGEDGGEEEPLVALARRWARAGCEAADKPRGGERSDGPAAAMRPPHGRSSELSAALAQSPAPGSWSSRPLTEQHQPVGGSPNDEAGAPAPLVGSPGAVVGSPAESGGVSDPRTPLASFVFAAPFEGHLRAAGRLHRTGSSSSSTASADGGSAWQSVQQAGGRQPRALNPIDHIFQVQFLPLLFPRLSPPHLDPPWMHRPPRDQF